MGIYGKNDFPAKIKFRVFLIVLMLVMSLVACTNQGDSDMEGEVGDNIANPDLQLAQVGVDDVENIPLSLDIDSLVLEKNIGLSISQHDGFFIPASSSFTQRIIRFLEFRGEAVAKVVDVGIYDLVMKFNGYRDIHVNLDTNTFWFAGADHLYSIHHSFSDQWDRYIIRVVDSQLMYDTFEKTILQKSFFVDRDGTKNTATLFFDGDIRLRINNAETVIASNVSEKSLHYNDSTYPLTSYSIKTFGEEPLIAVVNDFPTVHGLNTKLDLFSYSNEGIYSAFSTSDMTCELNAIDFEKGEVTIGLPFANASLGHILTHDEREQTDEKLQEFIDNEVKIDDDYIKTVRDGISCTPTKIAFVDGDNGSEEMLISASIQSVGARTPVRFNTDVVFIFEIKENLIKYKDSE